MITIKLEGYENIHVVQKDKCFGSVIVGIEWMLKYKGIEVPEIESFQENFNSKANNESNSFESITKRINEKYPHINFSILNFPRGQGKEKIDEVERTVKKGNPCLISIGLNKPFSSGIVFHTVPAVEVDGKTVKVLSMNTEDVKYQVKSFDRKMIEKLHDGHDGGKSILVLS